MTFTTRFVHSIASPIGYTEFFNVLLRALEVAGGIVPHPTKNITLGLTLLPVPRPDIEADER